MFEALFDSTYLSYLLVVFAAFVGFLSALRSRDQCNGRDAVQGPAYWFGLGPMLTYRKFLVAGVPEAASYYADLYGDFVRVWIAGVPTYLTTRPTAANHVMKTNGTNYTLRFGDAVGLEHIGMLQNGIIWNTDVSKWKILRAYFQRAVNAEALGRAVSLSVTATNRMLTTVLPSVQSRYSDQRVEMLNFLRLITLEVVNKLTINVQIDDEERFVSEIVAYFKAWEYFLLKPSWTYRLFGNYDKHVRAIETIKCSVQRLIDKKRQQIHIKQQQQQQQQQKDRDDFTEWLIDALRSEEISDEDLQQCVLEMLLAGTDTSSVTMYYALVGISQNKHVDQRIQQELNDVIGDQAPTKHHLPKLVYLEAVLKESLRFKPVGPVVLRRAIKDDVIDEFPVAAGNQVIVNLARMHRRPSAFEQPDKFNPDRFMEKNEVPAEEFVPFGTGPKGCVGQFLAMVEMKSILATLLRRYRAVTATNIIGVAPTLEEMQTRWDIAQQPMSPSFMYLVPRS